MYWHDVGNIDNRFPEKKKQNVRKINRKVNININK